MKSRADIIKAQENRYQIEFRNSNGNWLKWKPIFKDKNKLIEYWKLQPSHTNLVYRIIKR
jgi:hypothetical protein